MARRSILSAHELFGRLGISPDMAWMQDGTTPEHTGAPPPEADDGAVVAAVLISFWEYAGGWKDPPVLYLGGDGWPDCDWSRWGLTFYDGSPVPRDAPRSERKVSYSFARPQYDSGGALIETGASFKGSGGYGGVCRVRRDADGWYVDGAKQKWLS